MNPNKTLEEVMQKIRARVGTRRGEATYDVHSIPQENKNDRASVRISTPRIEVPANDLEPLHAEIDIALEGTRRVGQINPRNPGLFNSLTQFVKKVMRRSLTWYTRPLHYFQNGAIRALQQTENLLQSHERTLRILSNEFNRQSELIESVSQQAAASVEAVTPLQKAAVEIEEGIASRDRRIDAMEQELQKAANLADEMDQRLDGANAELARTLGESMSAQDQKFGDRMGLHADMIAGVKGDIEDLRAALARLGDGLRQTQQQGRLRDRDLRRFFHDIQSGAVTRAGKDKTSAVPPMFPTGVQRERDFDYFGFEDLYRGDEAAISIRQKAYVEYFRGRQNVLDVGCGRGEFLELLQDNNVAAKGVELGTDQYLLCKEKGLVVVQQDLFAYLESLPDESLGGLFSAQVIEHLAASDQLRYVVLAYEKTSPGSPVIFETINAQCVWAVMRNFFLDPTHVRPLHPETLKFAMETVKFKNVQLHFSSPLKERQIPPLQLPGDVPNLAEFNQRIAQLNELLYGDQDYAAIGWH